MAIGIAVVALLIAVVSAAYGFSACGLADSLKRNQQALLDEHARQFQAFMLSNHHKLSPMEETVGRLTGMDQKFSALTARVEDIAGALEGGLDDRLDERLRPIHERVQSLALAVGMKTSNRREG